MTPMRTMWLQNFSWVRAWRTLASVLHVISYVNDNKKHNSSTFRYRSATWVSIQNHHKRKEKEKKNQGKLIHIFPHKKGYIY